MIQSFTHPFFKLYNRPRNIMPTDVIHLIAKCAPDNELLANYKLNFDHEHPEDVDARPLHTFLCLYTFVL